MKKVLIEKIKDSLQSVLPMTLIILLICIISGMALNDIILFIIGALLLILGLTFFTLGATGSMMPLAENIGTYVTKKRKLPLLIAVIFVIGFMIALAEPSLWVFIQQFATDDSMFFIMLIAIASGLGLFVLLSILRVVFQLNLRIIFLILYTIIFIFAFFINRFNPNFLPAAFDSGGAVTGPMAVPFIMALGLGVSLSRGDSRSDEDSFGILGLATIGPIITVMMMGLFTKTDYVEAVNNLNLFGYLLKYIKSVAIAMMPFIIFFIVFQIFVFKFNQKRVIRIVIAFLFTYLGLVLFLTGANAGFVPAADFIGITMAKFNHKWLLIPAGMVFGATIVAAEPSVIILNKQIEEITGGAISKLTMMLGMSSGVAIAIGLAIVRVFTGINILWILVPTYGTALLLMFFVPKIFTSIAFDSGSAVSGAMSSAFLVPFVIGAASIINPSNILTDAFGVIAFVAMAPFVTIQILGLIFKIRQPKPKAEIIVDEIIELNGVKE